MRKGDVRMKRILALLLCVICIGTLVGCVDDHASFSEKDDVTSVDTPMNDFSSVPSSSTPSSSAPSSSTTASEYHAVIDPNPKVQVEGTPSWKCTGVTHNTGVNIDDNIFMDALIYTGYNVEKHRADGAMWQYVLAARKRGYGWLSKIGYNTVGTGFETTEDGKPDIAALERKKLDCASFVAYVYFNYLPNVAGIDTSCLARPEVSWKAYSIKDACEEWEKQGFTRRIPHTYSGKPGQYLRLEEKEEIPVGSIICFKDARNPSSDHCAHVSIYAGYANNYHWVYHVGNDNGPEFCAVERMTFGPDPQYMLEIFATPQFILDKMK